MQKYYDLKTGPVFRIQKMTGLLQFTYLANNTHIVFRAESIEEQRSSGTLFVAKLSVLFKLDSTEFIDREGSCTFGAKGLKIASPSPRITQYPLTRIITYVVKWGTLFVAKLSVLFKLDSTEFIDK